MCGDTVQSTIQEVCATDKHTQKNLFIVIRWVLVYTWLLLEYPKNWCILNKAAMGPTWTRTREERRIMSPFFIAIVSAGPVVCFEIGLILLQ